MDDRESLEFFAIDSGEPQENDGQTDDNHTDRSAA
jgi:hypothetical protein